MSYNKRDEQLNNVEKVLRYFGITNYSYADKGDIKMWFGDEETESQFVKLMKENGNSFHESRGFYRFEKISLKDTQLMLDILNDEI